jgi:uncharacterized protein (TIGR03437 family)
LWFILAGTLCAVETLHLRISSEAVPEGGLAQIKLFVTPPQPIASGRIVFQRDPSVFGAVSQATVFSIAGDAYGSWFASPCECLGIRLGDLAAQFASPSAGVGRSPDLPILEVTASVDTGTHSVMLDLSRSSFKNPQGVVYLLDVQPGFVTVGEGTLSLSNVTPGGGLIPTGTVLSIQGTGFTPSTLVEIDGVDSASSEFVSPSLIHVALAAPAEMDGKRVRLRSLDGAQVDYWSWLHYSPDLFAGTQATECATCGMIFPRNTAAAASWFANPHPNHGFGIAFLNPNPVPVEVTVTQPGQVSNTSTDTIPPATTVQTNPPMPIRMLGYDYTPAGSSDTIQSYPIIRLGNAASGFVDSVAPGEIISIYGLNLSLETSAGLVLGSDGRVASELEGTRVLFDGVPAPLLYVSASQINAIVPYEVAEGQLTTIQVEYTLDTNAVWEAPVVDAAPGIFRFVLNQDDSVNSLSNPAARGSIIQIFATGQGITSPPGVTGSVTDGSPPTPVLPVGVTIGGIDAPVQSAGSVQDAVAGLFQATVLVPQSLPPSLSVPIVLTVGSASSQDSVSIAVH